MSGRTIKMLQGASENFHRASSQCVMSTWPNTQQFW